MKDQSTSIDEPEDQSKPGSGYLHLSGKQRDHLIKRLALFSLPTREIVRLTGMSSRTVARTLQRLGIKRKKFDVLMFPFSRKQQTRHLMEILTQYYALNHYVLLDSLHHLAKRNGISLKKLFDLIRQHVSPSRWAIRSCLACGQPALTSGPADRYCVKCKKRVKKAHGGLDE